MDMKQSDVVANLDGESADDDNVVTDSNSAGGAVVLRPKGEVHENALKLAELTATMFEEGVDPSELGAEIAEVRAQESQAYKAAIAEFERALRQDKAAADESLVS
jgi:hypothetical protein